MSASLSALVSKATPPLSILHSVNGRLVPMTHSEEAIAAWHATGAAARTNTFEGPSDSHDFWTDGDLHTRKLVHPLARLLRQHLKT